MTRISVLDEANLEELAKGLAQSLRGVFLDSGLDVRVYSRVGKPRGKEEVFYVLVFELQDKSGKAIPFWSLRSTTETHLKKLLPKQVVIDLSTRE